MNTYTFSFAGSYTSNDPTTPVSSGIGITLAIEAPDVDSAKDALSAVFAQSGGTVEITGIVVIP
jgi:hypothetical protein